MKIVQTNRFAKAVKKLHSAEKKQLDKAIQAIIENPEIGSLKVGDLAGIRVHKFKMKSQLVLLAYKWINEESCLLMLSFGSHENFYRDLKQIEH